MHVQLENQDRFLKHLSAISTHYHFDNVFVAGD